MTKEVAWNFKRQMLSTFVIHLKTDRTEVKQVLSQVRVFAYEDVRLPYLLLKV